MHLKRLIVAVVLLPLFYLYVMYLPSVYFFFLLVIISLLAMAEFYSMYHVTGILKYACLLLGVSILGVSYISMDLLSDAVMISVMTVLVIRLLARRNPLSSLYDISPPVIGLFYVAGFCAFQTRIRKLGPEWIIFLYACVWMSDSLAYYFGTLFGKRKLYAEVSPNKTVAGAVGSLVGGVMAALFFRAVMIPSLALSYAVSIGIIIGTVSIIGDLVESMFKRDARVKDSSVMIPGHGGILDKIDGVLFAGPMLYWILLFFGIEKIP